MNLTDDFRYCIIKEQDLKDLESEVEVWQIEKIVDLIESGKLHAEFIEYNQNKDLADIEEGYTIVYDKDMLTIFRLIKEEIAYFEK